MAAATSMLKKSRVSILLLFVRLVIEQHISLGSGQIFPLFFRRLPPPTCVSNDRRASSKLSP